MIKQCLPFALEIYKFRAVRLKTPTRFAFTLVEILVVLFIFLLLSAIALPTVRKLLVDQKTTRSASAVTNFLDLARSRSIAEGRYFGVRLERVRALNTIEFGSGASIVVRQIVGIPPYTGESAEAKVEVITAAGNAVAELRFPVAENQLITLGNIVAGPVKSGDIIEFAGGGRYHLSFNVGTTAMPINGKTPTALPVELKSRARIDLRGPADGSVAPATATLPPNLFPAIETRTETRSLKYRIHRAPVRSAAQPVTFPRGVAVDLTYSGFGVSGNSFSPVASPDVNDPIEILFGPDGRVEFCSLDSLGTLGSPPGLIFLCVGNTDGVRPDSPLSTERRATANILNLNSIWVVINPNTGRSVSAPFASVNPSPALTVETAIRQARSLALLADTLDAQP